MSTAVHAFDYLAAPKQHPPAPVCVAFGDERFLKRLVLAQLRGDVLGADEGDVPFALLQGADAQWRDVRDELSTVSLFGTGPRLVVVEDADQFVSTHRSELEDYVARPSPSGVLVLDVSSFPGNTRLYKSVAKTGLPIECRPPMMGRRNVIDTARLVEWLSDWARGRHQVKLGRGAGDLLLELVGPELGLLDQELAKLALCATAGGKVTAQTVRETAGGWRTKTVWELIEAASDGDAPAALKQLDRLLMAGQDPRALFGPMSWALRRFAAATRIVQQNESQNRRVNLRDVLEQAGFRKWPREALERAERQLRQLGRQRAGQLYRWLLEADLALKGTHSAPGPARAVLERLLVRLSRAADPRTRGREATPVR